MSLEGKTVLITGASSGIGRAAGVEFAKAGAIPILAARSRPKLEKALEEISDIQPRAGYVRVDVSDRTRVEAMVDEVLARFGKIDVLFNNAGHATVGPIEGADFSEDTRSMFDVDFMGTVNVTKAVLPSMRARGEGRILNMSSVVGRKAFARFGGYSAVMHALAGFTDALRQELDGSGVRVSIIHPALTQTPLLSAVAPDDMPPTFRSLSPLPVEQVARAAVEGVRRGRRRIVVPAQPRLLMLLDAISPVLGDAMVGLLERPLFGRLIGSYRGTRYAHGESLPAGS
jgi:NAD(P)-dependent dehydrogenase (short-subunit alcohol dehydrogenase family)